MGVTPLYSQAHDALLTTARVHGLVPFDVRVLVALEERGGEGRTDDLEEELFCEGTAIRRSYPILCAKGLAVADAGPGTGGPRRGTRTRLVLTDRGHLVALQALAWTVVRDAA